MNTNIRYHRKRRQKEAKENGHKNKFTQQDLADVLKVPRSRISMMESGQALPTIEEIEEIAEYLEVTTGHLVTAKQLDFLMDQ